jgi:hypothetical protein
MGHQCVIPSVHPAVGTGVVPGGTGVVPGWYRGGWCQESEFEIAHHMYSISRPSDGDWLKKKPEKERRKTNNCLFERYFIGLQSIS